jgi:carboxyl-terminal processing protease
VTITKVFRETPAEHAGLLEGDVIVGVGPNDATTWTTEMASDSIRGPAGTPVKIMIKRPGISVDVPYTMTRAQVHVASVTAGIVDGTKVGYIRMDQVTRGSAQEIDSALTMLTGGGATGLVIDLRRNPGGFLDEALMTSDIFLKPGEKLASLVSRNANVRTNNGTTSEDFTDQARAKAPTVPIAVLVDEYTASAAEIISGALQDHDRALVIGQRTFGKGIVQSVLDLPYGYKLRITTGSWQTPLGREIHRARDAGGKLLGEDPDTFPKVRTATGREIVNGGGIFPDLSLTADTLKTVERQLEETSAQKQVPLGVRIAEFAFQEAQRIRQAGGAQEIGFSPASFQAFLDRLQREGVPAETIANPQVKDYLSFRVRETIAQRLANREGSLAKVLSERDNVLGQAIKLVQQSPTQTELYANAKKVTQAASARPGSN